MRYFYLAIIIIGMLVANNILHAQNNDKLDTEGTDFWFTFTPNAHNMDNPYSPTGYLHIYVTSKTPTKGKIYYNEVKSTGVTSKEVDFEIKQPNEVYHFSVQYFYVALRGQYVNGYDVFNQQQATQDNEVVSVKSFHITTEEKSVVYALDYDTLTADAFIVLPTPSLGKEYFIMSYYSSILAGIANNNCPSQFAIVGVEDNTTITIVPSVPTYSYGLNTQTITLNKGEVYLVQSRITTLLEDFTGTYILADKKIAVIGGHQRTAIPPDGLSRDCLLAQMLPVSTWGKNAIITPFAVSTNNSFKDIYRILAANDNTDIYIDGVFVKTLNKGKYYQAELTKASVISSNNPIMVATYTKTGNSNNSAADIGDPTMIIMPPVEQYKNSYTVINAPFKSRQDGSSIFHAQYLGIIAPIEAIEEGLYLNGSPLSLSIFDSIGETGYYYVNYKSKDGTHNLNSKYPFCVIVYGYGPAVSYGYLGGMSMQELDSISLVINANGCCQNFFQATYTESFHSGIGSVEIIDTINCTIEEKRKTKWKIIWDLKKIDKSKDAIISIKVTDIYGNVTIYTDTIKTKYLLADNCFDTKTIDFGKSKLGTMNNYKINIINKESDTVTLTSKDFILNHNINFTISKSILPIIIPPKDTATIQVYYSPTKVQIDKNKETILDKDTLIIFTDCFAYIFALEGEPIADTLLMTGVCNIPLVLIGDTVNISFASPTITPNPTNSSAINYKFPVYSDSDVSIKILDIEGKHTNIFTGFLSVGMYEMFIDVSDFVSGNYFIHIESDTYNHSNKLVIER